MRSRTGLSSNQMKYKLKDLQGAGLKEGYTFDSREAVKRNLYDFHVQDLDLKAYEAYTLEDLLEIGGWELIEIA